MNVPNRLTILRVIMIPLFVAAMLWPGLPYSDYVAGALFITACVTDFFDGYPLADKLLVSAALICFLADADSAMPVWAVIIIISREFIISGFRLVAAEKGVTIAANYWGKVKTVVQMIMSILLIFDFRHPVFRAANVIFVYAAVILTVISLVDYIYKNRDIMKDVK